MAELPTPQFKGSGNSFVLGLNNIKADQCCDGCGKNANCRVSIPYTSDSGTVTLTSLKKDGSTLSIGKTINSVDELINALNEATGETWAADGNGVFLMTGSAYTELDFGDFAVTTVCPEFKYCISRTDAGDAGALSTAQDDYAANGLIVRKNYINGKSYYELPSNSATAPSASGSDTIGSNPCFE